jgi:hypothetical protein
MLYPLKRLRIALLRLNNPFCRFCLCLAFLCLSAYGEDRYVFLPPYMLKVSAKGTVEVVDLPRDRGTIATERGSTLPCVSPDNRWIAFIRDFDLWLFNTSTRGVRRATYIGRPYSETLASVEVLIVAWSADSSRVLINVASGELECVDCDSRLDWKSRKKKNGGDWKQRKAKFGYFTYQLADKSLRKRLLPSNFEVAKWLADGSLVGTSSVTSRSPIFILSPNGGLRSVGHVSQVSQVDASIDGTSALVTIIEKRKKDDAESSSYIARVNIADGVVTRLTEFGYFAEYQFPRLSPDKKHNAWMRQIIPPSGKVAPDSQPSSAVIVDGKTILQCPVASLSLEWLDEQRILTYCASEIAILDAETGQRLATTRVPAN